MKAIVVANWKMNPGSWREAKALFERTRKAANHAKRASVIVAPPALYLHALSRGRGKIALAMQDAYFEKDGAHTGEISMVQAKDAHSSYVIIGHAERRKMGETDEMIGKKVASALAQRLTPILCIGEKERKGGEYYNVVREQLRAALAEVGLRANRVLIVYEPLWTIGKDTTMSPRKMHEMSIFIRKTIVDLYGDVGRKVKILYGGSVTKKDAGAMLKEGDVKGFLVGRASLDAYEFTALLEAIQSA